MAEFKVLKEFRLLDDPKVPGKGKVYQPEEVIDIAVKRADQVIKTLGSSFLKRIDKKPNEEVVEETQTIEEHDEVETVETSESE